MAWREQLDDDRPRVAAAAATDVDPLHHHDREEERRYKSRHKHHRKHKHHKHRESEVSAAAAAPPIEETEDGEILEQEAPRVDTNGGSDSDRRKSPARKRSRSKERERYRSRSRGDDSVERKHRSRSRDVVATRSYHGNSPDHKRRRSRSRDGARRDDRGRRYGYSPERRREHDESRYRRNVESRERSYRRDDHTEKTEDGRHDGGGKVGLKDPAVSKVEEENQDEYLERVASQLAEQEEDVEKVKLESRKRRQAIMEKYKKQQQEQAAAVAKPPASAPAPTSAPTPAPAPEPDSGEGIIDPATPVALAKPVSESSSVPRKTALGEGSPSKSENPGDMFCDIFGESPAEGHKVGKGDGLAVDTSGLTDNWDDPDGYYIYRVGEVLDNRYEIASSHGRGVFSTVVKARDTKAARGNPEEVAIKIIRSNETMFKAGQMELVILKKLAGADPENKRHCVRLLSSFEYRHHLCLVFESLHMNLREILKKFGRNIGLSLRAVHTYAFQLFTALKHLRNCGVLHCDIKPDNMLVNETKNVLKLCDFGSAMFTGDNSLTPYLVSRFYRAPEIILGLPYDHALDMWSVGCCLYELFTGKVLFAGATNNDMLRLHMELKGPFPKKMLRKALFTGQHFDQDFNFYAGEEDPVTKKAVKRMITNIKAKEFSTLISSSDEDPKLLASFKLLLEKIFVLDPEKRLTVSQALDHPFIRQGFDPNLTNNNTITNTTTINNNNVNGNVQNQTRW